MIVPTAIQQPNAPEGVARPSSFRCYTFSRMTDKDERLKHLAELASNEQDLQKFKAIVREITLILEEKQERLGKMRIPSKPSE